MKLFKVFVLGATAIVNCQGKKLRGQKAQNEERPDRKLGRFWVPGDATSNGGYYEGIPPSTNKPTDSPTGDAQIEQDPTASPVWKGDAWKTDGYPTLSPSLSPTIAAIEPEPTKSPVWKGDSWGGDAHPPSASPTEIPFTETGYPTLSPTLAPTISPSFSPTLNPTLSPFAAIVPEPTKSPVWKGDAWKADGYPTLSPSLSPTIAAIEPEPTKSPAWKGDAWKSDGYPTLSPSLNPTLSPEYSPTKKPTANPTNAPTEVPPVETNQPTDSPVYAYDPTAAPVNAYDPTAAPSKEVEPTEEDDYSGWLDWDDDQFNRKKLVL